MIKILEPQCACTSLTPMFVCIGSLTLSQTTTGFSLSLNIFILHRLRNKFLQLILISLDSASLELHQYSRRMRRPMKNPKVETRSRDSNSGPHDCKADALPHDHRHCWIFTCTQHKSFESTVRTWEIARNGQFLLFPQCFLPFRRTFCHFHRI